MAHSKNTNPVISELDDIAAELEKTGNADLATLVDEVSAEIMTAPSRTVAAKKNEKKEEKISPKARSKKNKKPASKKEAETNFGSRRARIAAAMRKIARAQVAELEDIAAELVKEGEKKAALEVLKIAEDLDSDYEYSTEGKHSSPESKGDASKRFDRTKANKPDAKMDAEEKERLEPPFGEKGEGYPLKQSAFDKQLDNLIRLAMEGEEEMADDDSDSSDGASDADSADEDMDVSDESEDATDDDSDDSSDEDSDEGDGDLDMGGLDEDSEEGGSDDDADDMDLGGLDLGDGDDELASMMEAMDGAEPQDTEASDRMYEAEEDDGAEAGEEDPAMPPAAGGAPMAGEEDEEEDPDMDDASDMEALDTMPPGTPAAPPAAPAAAGGAGMKFSSADKQKMITLAKKLLAKGEKKLAARVATLAKK